MVELRRERRNRGPRGRAGCAPGSNLAHGLRAYDLPAEPGARARILPESRGHRRTDACHGAARRRLDARSRTRQARLPGAIPRTFLTLPMFYELSASTWGPEET